MKRFDFKPYLFFLLFFLLFGFFLKKIAPPFQEAVVNKALPHWDQGKKRSDREEELLIENHQLKKQNEELEAYLLQFSHLDREIEAIEQKATSHFFSKKVGELQKAFQEKSDFVLARVLYREPALWSSLIWVEAKDEKVEVDAPVVLGNALVGIVEEVKGGKARVRLLTDRKLTPSVRVVRGFSQDGFLLSAIDQLVKAIEVRKDLKCDSALKDALAHIQGQLGKNIQEDLLAKGEMVGAAKSSMRHQTTVLKGIGFNYDFSDEEGPARELRTGLPLGSANSALAKPLLQLGDLLITTGMDGIFPPGLVVGTVSHIVPLREGEYTYEIEALAAAGNFAALDHVFILSKK